MITAKNNCAYRENRARISFEKLQKVDGRWIAFSADGQRIVASAASIAELSKELGALRVKLGDVVLEHIEIESAEINLGAAEIM
jgi:hypothetical protein